MHSKAEGRTDIYATYARRHQRKFSNTQFRNHRLGIQVHVRNKETGQHPSNIQVHETEEVSCP